MKRYTCPHCKSQYHIEPKACPICCWSIGEDELMLDAAHETVITLRDGMAWFEDGTSISATVELLMAAPKLLSALEIMIIAGEDMFGTHYREAMRNARAAVALAGSKT